MMSMIDLTEVRKRYFPHASEKRAEELECALSIGFKEGHKAGVKQATAGFNELATSENEFIRWVAERLCKYDVDESPGEFAESACRKLYKMEMIKKVDDMWVYEVPAKQYRRCRRDQ